MRVWQAACGTDQGPIVIGSFGLQFQTKSKLPYVEWLSRPIGPHFPFQTKTKYTLTHRGTYARIKPHQSLDAFSSVPLTAWMQCKHRLTEQQKAGNPIPFLRSTGFWDRTTLSILATLKGGCQSNHWGNRYRLIRFGTDGRPLALLMFGTAMHISFEMARAHTNKLHEPARKKNSHHVMKHVCLSAGDERPIRSLMVGKWMSDAAWENKKPRLN